MSMQKILSTLLLILGAGVFAFGQSMAIEVAQEEGAVSQAEENMQESRRPTLGPVRRNVRAESREEKQQKIGGKLQLIAKSQVTANWLRGSGIVLFVAGLGGLIWSFSSKKES